MTEAIALDFGIYRKAGPLRNGAERGHGSIYHAVQGEYAAGGPALCGAQPAIQWSSLEGAQVSCPKCCKLLARAFGELTAESK